MRLLTLIALVTIFTLMTNHNAWAIAETQTTEAKQAYIIDFETGQVLLQKNAAEHMPTSSMSKAMTCYMIFEAIHSGVISMDTEFQVSEKAWQKGGSKMFVEVGKAVKVKDLLRGVIIQSGNDATIVLAEGLAGSEETFADKMNEKAKELGMMNSHFSNASGWPDPDHYSTAEDLAILTRHMINDFPEYYKLFSETEFSYNNIKQQNRNPLLYRNIGADGLKTGHTDIGGYGMIGTALQDDRRVIMVVNGLPDETVRASESTRLITWALNSFANISIARDMQKITLAPVAMGAKTEVPLLVKGDLRVTMPKAAKDDFTVDLQYKTPLVAPIKQGDEVGIMTLKIPHMEPVIRPLIAAEDVASSGFFKRMLSKMEYTFFGKK